MSRCHAIDQFNRGVYDYLLATDECQPEEKVQSSSGSKCSKRRDKEYGVSRGIDFQMVSNVINFDFPLTPTFYVHRVGRTARADQMGTALSFVNRTEEKLLTAVEALLNPAGLAASGSQASDVSDTKASSIFRPYQFRLSEVDGFRYRAMDVLRRITRKVVREARLKEIKLELLNSDRLKGYFEDHTPDLEALRHDKPLVRMTQPHLKDIPEYLVPAPLRALMSGSSGGRRMRNRWKRENLNLGTVEKPRSAGKKRSENPTNLQTKHQLARKRKAQNPLFSFGKKSK
ncbi:hypothetical protein P879_08449 [Paragonimus westermani]|uniref:RNA helicase n=1 Tax=Paragonimus westermani TaxID=34504 RepID=A0A8T0D1E0_9TREM|nr:hypothetical protein P879_08449 [Paragonimus westermani]